MTSFPHAANPHRTDPHATNVEMVDVVGLERLRQSPMLRLLLVAVSAAVGGVLVSVAGFMIGFGLVFGLSMAAVVWRYPPTAGYIMIGLAPTIVGFERGQVLPVLRPNEALLFFLVGVLLLRWGVHSRRIPTRIWSLDIAMVAMVLTGFLLPLLVQVARNRPLLADDVLYAAVFIRLLLLYLLFRSTIRTTRQVKIALGVSLVVASLMGILGTAGALNVAGLGQRLSETFAPGTNFQYSQGRGMGLIGNPIGYGVYEAIHACIAIALLLYKQRPRKWLVLAALCCTVGLFGSAQFGPLLAFVVGITSLAIVTKNVQVVLRWAVPMLLVASVVIIPLFGQRLDRFEGVSLPSERRDEIQQEVTPSEQGRELYFADPGSSWDVRLYNLQELFLPEFKTSAHWVWGVTPQARVFAPPTGKEYAWIESGILWLFWTGGIPLVAAWHGFLLTALTISYRLVRRTNELAAAVGAAAFSSIMAVGLAQAFDPHVTLRGTVDIFYPLLAITVAGWVGYRTRSTETQTHD